MVVGCTRVGERVDPLAAHPLQNLQASRKLKPFAILNISLAFLKVAVKTPSATTVSLYLFGRDGMDLEDLPRQWERHNKGMILWEKEKVGA
jgi:hypothetical protein